MGLSGEPLEIFGNPIKIKSTLTDFASAAGKYIKIGYLSSVGALPTADASNLGKFIIIEEGELSGVATKLVVYYRKDDDSYARRDLISGVDV